MLFLYTKWQHQLYMFFVETTTSSKESNKPKQVIQIIHFTWFFCRRATMVYYCDAVECKLLQSKEATHPSLHSWHDVGKVAKKSLHAEKMERHWFSVKGREEYREPHKKLPAMFLSFWQGKHQHWQLHEKWSCLLFLD